MRNKKILFQIQRIGRRKKPIPAAARALKTRVLLKYIGVAILTAIFSTMVHFQEQAGDWFKASVLDNPEPFNGTVMPVDKVPNWVRWNGDHITAHYLSIPESDLIPLPPYDPALLAYPAESLVWRNGKDDAIYNTQLTYPVVYLGNYKNDHDEEKGSHLAVDIKMPKGTPVRAIANGKVIKAIMEESGFGHHLVLKHIGVPDPENPDVLTTLYSGYNHLSDIRVREGQNVLKGDIIATSGNTGTSTTPHLHLQIDRESAPWHPYWPFTWQEAQNAGLSFFEAVNAGLGIDRARQYTVNPMMFIMNNLNYGAVASNRPVDVPPPENPAEPAEAGASEPAIVIVSENPPEPVTIDIPVEEGVDPSLFTFKMMGETVGMAGSGVTITLIDETGQVASLSDDQSLALGAEGVGHLLKNKLTKADFSGNAAKLIVRGDYAGEAVITVGKSSHKIRFVDAVKNAAAFTFEHDGHFQKDVVETVKLIAVDTDGVPTPVANFSGTVEITVEDGRAVVTPNRVEAEDFKNGVIALRVRASDEKPVTLRAQNGAIVGQSIALQPESATLFADIASDHPNYSAIRYLKDLGVIGGYPDGTFRPDNTVNRAEALKMLMLAFGVQTGVAGPLSFSDTEKGAWYETALATAVEKGIVKGYPDGSFRPGQTVNRAEYLKILFNAAGEEFHGSLISKPYKDVERTDWFASYAYLANQKNIIDAAEDALRPQDGMTRAGVAETIYRLRTVREGNVASYNP